MIFKEQSKYTPVFATMATTLIALFLSATASTKLPPNYPCVGGPCPGYPLPPRLVVSLFPPFISLFPLFFPLASFLAQKHGGFFTKTKSFVARNSNRNETPPASHQPGHAIPAVLQATWVLHAWQCNCWSVKELAPSVFFLSRSLPLPPNHFVCQNSLILLRSSNVRLC